MATKEQKLKNTLVATWVSRGADPVKASRKADHIVEKMKSDASKTIQESED
ncbi:hypothetical protein [Adonisia turfae]|uniref:hypothetical protein n=1 Tax=Adonisia turfae TaxID=2950184 RepID=UPI0013D2AA15|nr:hypothetical protein [Adonisia turfae]